MSRFALLPNLMSLINEIVSFTFHLVRLECRAHHQTVSRDDRKHQTDCYSVIAGPTLLHTFLSGWLDKLDLIAEASAGLGCVTVVPDH
jgi:hypothetical protein